VQIKRKLKKMDSDFTNNEKELFSKDNLFLLRKQKIQKEIEAARRLIEKKVDILEIADNFIHNTFKLMSDGILNRDDKLTEEDIKQRIKNNISFKDKLKAIKKRDNHHG
jgi:hypothetical protein